jgi:hypothetical protein
MTKHVTTVNPVQPTTYYLANNPIDFGTGTNINVSSGSGIGVDGSSAQSWSVTNEGAISGHLYGVDLTAGGSITNKAGATISGGYAGLNIYHFVYNNNVYTYDRPFADGGGVRILGGTGTVTNAGKISGASFGVDLAAGGSVTNQAGATISGQVLHGIYDYYVGVGILVAGGVGTVTNAGEITDFSNGIELQAGGSVTNLASGTINGGVFISAGGSVTNEAGGTINGLVQGGAGAVTNSGTISSVDNFAVGLSAGGSVTNEAGGTITCGSIGVALSSASVTNEAGATIAGDIWGIKSTGVATVTNAGAVNGRRGNANGVSLYGGGSLVNEASGTISGGSNPGGYGVLTFFHAATVTNAGAITGNIGVGLDSGGSVTNQGAGTISGDFDGVFLQDGSLTNQAGGTIIGTRDGVRARGVAVTNAGTISGTAASVQFFGYEYGANTLTLETGSTLIGDAIGSTASGATNALVLEGHGTANNNFDNFNTLNVQANGNWTLGGASTFGATTVSGRLVVAGDVTGGATVLGDPAGDLAQLAIASTGVWDIADDSGIGLVGPALSPILNSGCSKRPAEAERAQLRRSWSTRGRFSSLPERSMFRVRSAGTEPTRSRARSRPPRRSNSTRRWGAARRPASPALTGRST